MAMDIAKIAALVIFMQITCMAGVFFISGQLLPGMLANLYSNTGPVVRTVAASLFFFPLGNYILACTYSSFNPCLVTPLYIAAFVLVNVAFTILILNIKPSLWIMPATAIMAIGCVWVSIILNQKTP